MASIIEGLQNAQFNVESVARMNPSSIQLIMAKDQLGNAVSLLEKGYSIEDDIEETIEAHGGLDQVPEKSTDDEG